MLSRADKAELTKRPIWLLCEGNDCYFFFLRIIEKLGLYKIYCHDVKGIKDKNLFKEVMAVSNYNMAKVIIYARDAEYPAESVISDSDEKHMKSVIQSIQSRFESIRLTVGDKQLELTDNNDKKAGYIILTSKNGCTGTLEDLYLDIAGDVEAVDDAESTVNYINEKRNGKVSKHTHKRKMHIAFALNEKEEMIGAKSGEAVLRGGLDINHERFRAMKEFLISVNSNKQLL